MNKLKLAILDMYEGTPNQGMRCIKEIADAFRMQLEWDVYDVRRLSEVPDLDYDIYISSGGPGDPLEGNGVWDVRYYDWLQQVYDWNRFEERKKHVFFICHSFQMAAHYFQLAEVTPRRSMSFGTFPVHLTDAGVNDAIFTGLDNPIWAADFRRYQVIQPNMERIEEMGAEILALEKIRPHVPLERALMGIRFSPEMVGVQFHPEADPRGMIAHFVEPERRLSIMEEHGPEKYHQMLVDLRNPSRIARTHDAILPAFLRRAIAEIEACVPVMA
jgi:GMP synthase-like glutamine amidotransferase